MLWNWILVVKVNFSCMWIAIFIYKYMQLNNMLILYPCLTFVFYYPCLFLVQVLSFIHVYKNFIMGLAKLFGCRRILWADGIGRHWSGRCVLLFLKNLLPPSSGWEQWDERRRTSTQMLEAGGSFKKLIPVDQTIQCYTPQD